MLDLACKTPSVPVVGPVDPHTPPASPAQESPALRFRTEASGSSLGQRGEAPAPLGSSWVAVKEFKVSQYSSDTIFI